MVESKKPKVIEVRDPVEANRLEENGSYYIDRYSEKRDCYILMRRERQAMTLPGKR